MAFQVPDAEAHSGYCRTYVWRWRFEVRGQGGRPHADLSAWPCKCSPQRPWETIPAEHPSWCVSTSPHTWEDCTVSAAHKGR